MFCLTNKMQRGDRKGPEAGRIALRLPVARKRGKKHEYTDYGRTAAERKERTSSMNRTGMEGEIKK